MPELPFDLGLLRRYDVGEPRETSYPPPQGFRDFSADDHVKAVLRGNAANPTAPVSLYVYAPFCGSACYYCERTRVITHDEELKGLYLKALLREIELQGALFGGRRPVAQLHFGGGTPTFFGDEQLARTMDRVRHAFGLTPEQDRDVSIEVDPRLVDALRLERLASMGFNRVSLGVQDFDPDVQAAVHRVQIPEQVADLVREARRLAMKSVSLNLLYALPLQTLEGFERTLDRVIASQPDRITIRAYAHLPETFKAQRHIEASELPGPNLRLALQMLAIRKLTAVGYVHIGLDQFVRPGDELVAAMNDNRLQRNLRGYSTRAGLDLLGTGLSSISRIGGTLSQNTLSVSGYVDSIAAARLPTARGCVPSSEDQLRGSVIERILCGREVRYGVLGSRFGIDARRHFRAALAKLAPAARDGLVELLPDRLAITARGRYFLRALAMPFDAYAASRLQAAPSATPETSLP